MLLRCMLARTPRGCLSGGALHACRIVDWVLARFRGKALRLADPCREHLAHTTMEGHCVAGVPH